MILHHHLHQCLKYLRHHLGSSYEPFSLQTDGLYVGRLDINSLFRNPLYLYIDSNLRQKVKVGGAKCLGVLSND